MYVGPAVSGILHLGLLALALAPARPERLISPDYGPPVEVELMSEAEYNAAISDAPGGATAPSQPEAPQQELAMATPEQVERPDPGPAGVTLSAPPVDTVPIETPPATPPNAVDADTDAPELALDSGALQDKPVAKSDIIPNDNVRIASAPDAPEQPRGVMDAPNIDTDPDEPPEPEEIAEPTQEPAPSTEVAEAEAPPRNGAPPLEAPLPRAKPRGSLAAESSDEKKPASPTPDSGDGPPQRSAEADEEAERIAAEDARIAEEDARLAAAEKAEAEAARDLAAKRAAEEEASRELAQMKAEEAAEDQRIAEEDARLAAEEDAARELAEQKAAEEEAARELAEQKAAEEEAARELAEQKAAEEEAARELAELKAAEEAAARELAALKAAEDEARKLAEAEARRLEEEKAARLAAEQEKMREEMERIRQAQAEEQDRIAAQQAAREAEAQLQQQRLAEDQARRAYEQQQAKLAAEAEAQRQYALRQEQLRQYESQSTIQQQAQRNLGVGAPAPGGAPAQGDQFMAMLGGAVGSAQGGSQGGNRTFSNNVAAQNNSAPLSPGEQQQLLNQLSRCWRMMGQSLPVVTLRVSFTRDGRVARFDPVQVPPGGERALEFATRALQDTACQPFPLPPQKYGAWQQIDIAFDPRNLRFQ